MATQKNFLTDEELYALERIAAKSKMDCWFSVQTFGAGDFIYDIEQEKVMSLEDGIGQLTEGIVDGPEFYGLTCNEALTLNYLFEVLGLSFRFAKFDEKQINYKLKCPNLESLRRRVRRELDEYKRELKSITPEEIIDASYRTTWMGEIVQIIENTKYSSEQIKGLCYGKENILNFLYEEWMNIDADSVSELKDIIENVADKEYKKYPETVGENL